MKVSKALLMAVLPWVVGCASVSGTGIDADRDTPSIGTAAPGISPPNTQSIKVAPPASGSTRAFSAVISEIAGVASEIAIVGPMGNDIEVKVGVAIPIGSEIMTGVEDGLTLEVMHGDPREHVGLRVVIGPGSTVLLNSFKKSVASVQEYWWWDLSIMAGTCTSQLYMERSDFVLECFLWQSKRSKRTEPEGQTPANSTASVQ